MHILLLIFLYIKSLIMICFYKFINLSIKNIQFICLFIF